MTELVRPDLRYHASWAAAVREFETAGDVMHGSGLWDFDTSDLSETALAPEVERLLAAADLATVPRSGWVNSTNLWIAAGEEFVGHLAPRHRLTEFLLEEGGRIGYSDKLRYWFDLTG